MVHWEEYVNIEDSWIRERNIDPKMIKVYLEDIGKEMDKEKTSRGDYKVHKVDIQNTMSISVLKRGRSARTRPNLDM